ncbi:MULTISPECIES: cation diffusion facilitator family transporter [Kocuria]|uniref:cation diffusion facilitator family transporter n=1 Tax=Kocuria TaxID=57493 RepID=UPI0006616DE2|nr:MULTISPECIES: cation diffusion facilitator family transporter [Kocuria]MCT1368288.1 cation diffusion facilitator family transporter [Rothia sp. p3-SID1597]RUQ23197.1 cation transporter [Kocuria sp. HSID16901]
MGHAHDHHHGPGAGRKRLSIAFGISLSLFVVQLIGAAVTGSLALLFDTVHVLTDAAGLGMALWAAVLMERPATDHRTWGWKRVEVLAAAVQATVLIVVGIVVIVEAIQRFVTPQPVADLELIVFGALGLLGNIAAIVVLFGGEKSLNMKAAFLEVINDALGSVAVLVAATIIALTGWMQADAVVAIVIGLMIIPRALVILRESVSMLLESVPPGLDIAEVKRHIERHPHVVTVHDLHASRISTDLPVLTAHVVVQDGCFDDGHSAQLLCEIQNCISEHFDVSIAHSTIQLEPQSHYRHEEEEFTV